MYVSQNWTRCKIHENLLNGHALITCGHALTMHDYFFSTSSTRDPGCPDSEDHSPGIYTDQVQWKVPLEGFLQGLGLLEVGVTSWVQLMG